MSSFSKRSSTLEETAGRKGKTETKKKAKFRAKAIVNNFFLIQNGLLHMEIIQQQNEMNQEKKHMRKWSNTLKEIRHQCIYIHIIN